MSKQLERLKQRQAQIEAQLKAAEAKEKEKERKRETRRKILVGSYFLEKYRQADNFAALQQELETYLTRKDDRALFGLENKEES